MKKIYIKDDNGDDFLIENVEEFKKHIIKYHSITITKEIIQSMKKKGDFLQ